MKFWKFLLKLCRFKIVGYDHIDLKKCVIIMAPHTSIADFFIGLMTIRYLKLKMMLVMKKEFFHFPFNRILRKIGAIPVDREHALHFVDFAVNTINEREEVAFIICPEGTRKRVAKWKRGFYQIATGANIPICLSHIDFKTRTTGVGQIFYPTGDYEKDLAEIEKYYYGMQGYNKGWFNLEEKPN